MRTRNLQWIYAAAGLVLAGVLLAADAPAWGWISVLLLALITAAGAAIGPTRAGHRG